jgi:hypothetical protein
MKNLRWILPGLLVAGLMASGCWLVSGQFTVSADLPDPLNVASPTSLASAQIDLNTEKDYKDHKSDLKDLVEVALLGTFKNNTGTAISLEVWMTPALTNWTSETALNGDATRIKVWGPLSLGPSETKKIGWDESAKLFSKTGQDALLKEAKGDGSFTLYAKGTGGVYNFTIQHGVAVVVIDAGK